MCCQSDAAIDKVCACNGIVGVGQYAAMSKMKLYTATRLDGAMIMFSHPFEDEWSAEEVAAWLVVRAAQGQKKGPSGRPGASRLGRLAEYGYRITEVEVVYVQ